MALMHPVPCVGHRTGSPWPRRLRRRWARSDDVMTAAQLLAAIPSLPRAELSRLTERLIDRMDAMDGDADLEDDDPAGGCADDVGELDEWKADGIEIDLPSYGNDQSVGPINTVSAQRKHHAAWTAHFHKLAQETHHE